MRPAPPWPPPNSALRVNGMQRIRRQLLSGSTGHLWYAPLAAAHAQQARPPKRTRLPVQPTLRAPVDRRTHRQIAGKPGSHFDPDQLHRRLFRRTGNPRCHVLAADYTRFPHAYPQKLLILAGTFEGSRLNFPGARLWCHGSAPPGRGLCNDTRGWPSALPRTRRRVRAPCRNKQGPGRPGTPAICRFALARHGRRGRAALAPSPTAISVAACGCAP